jgi:hypothetical protein
MTSTGDAVLAAASSAGLQVQATAAGGLKVKGRREAVAKWAPTIREAKADILVALTARDEYAVDFDAIEERAALAADRIPVVYLSAWARLQCQRPPSIDLRAWRGAIDDAGLFLDAWGADAAAMRWSASELFGAPGESRAGGLVWQLSGRQVGKLGATFAILGDGLRVQRASDEE